MAPEIHISNATGTDASEMATCLFDAFSEADHPQSSFFDQVFPRKPSVHAFLESSLAEQMRREKGTVFLKAVDTSAENKIVGFVKWVPPGQTDGYWSEYGSDQDAALCDAFFGAMAEHREDIMGQRPHWFLELLGVNAKYARQGIGNKLLKMGLDLVDKDSVEAYVDASPLATPLYQRHGFEVKSTYAMPDPNSWFVESSMVRPRKA